MRHYKRLLSTALLLAVLLNGAGGSTANGGSPENKVAPRPKLVVVVSVDQLAYEYLDRFGPHFDDKGVFRRMTRDGATFVECHHRHAFTLTGPGHSVMLTGSYPTTNGIIDNGWFVRGQTKPMYCVEDPTRPIVGAAAEKSELKGVSPKNLLTTTVGDWLRQETGGRAKVFGLSLKDRAAVLMAGQKPDGAFWFDANTGAWVTSTYYASRLPGWLREINDGPLAEQYAGQQWRLLQPPNRYKLHHPDDAPFEGEVEGLGREFPHALEDQANARYFKQLGYTPFGNDLTLHVARQLIVHERLGQDDVPDIFCLGLSSNDYVGHTFGPHSLEVQDMTCRTDMLLGQFLDFLDQQVGVGAWTLALTADHAVAPIPEYAATIGLDGRRNSLDTVKLGVAIEAALVKKFGPPAGKSYVERVDGQQVFLRREESVGDADRTRQIEQQVREAVVAHPAIALAYTRDELLSAPPAGYEPIDQFRRACHPQRSGDVLFALKPYHILGKLPATHGSPWRYDTHVPLLFLGAGVPVGKFERPASPAMIAPTIARLLRVERPASCVESPLAELFGE